MRQAWRVLGSVLLAATASVGCATAQGLPPFYSAKEIRATVVAEETRRPLEGVVIVAQWVLFKSSLGHGGHGPLLHIAETVTNARGEFVIPPWGPTARLPLTYLKHRSPEIMLFKHGFSPIILHNGGPDETPDRFDFTRFTTTQINQALVYTGRPESAVQESFWNGQILQLPTFRGTPDEWFSQLKVLLNTVPGGSTPADPKSTQELNRALLGEKEYFRAHRVNPEVVANSVLDSFFIEVERRLPKR